MNESTLDPKIQEQFLSLPPMVRKLITESGWQNKIREIVKNNNLQIGQGAVIEDEVFLIMLGFEGPELFIQNIMREADIDLETAQKIESDVAQQIFAPLRQALMDSTQKAEVMTEDTNDSAISFSTPTEQTIIEPAPVQETKSEITESRDKILSEIENPALMQIAVGNTTPAIVAEAPKTPLSAPIAPTKTAPARVDPYREPIE